MIEGVDYAWSRPDIAELAAAGKRFACRYGGPGSDGKQLDPVEAQALSAAGVAIVANAEGSFDGLLGGWWAGVAWARDAEAHFAACGMPSDRPIYLSVDFNVSSSQWPAVANALRGAASVLGAGRVGIYGGRWAVEWARRDGVAQWFWQTYAWSGGVWVAGCHIQQYRNGVVVANATLDLDRATVSDFGQWTVGSVFGGNDMYCNYGDTNSSNVWVLQAELNDVLAYMGVPESERLALTWSYNDQTAAALMRIGIGNSSNNGHAYGPGEYKALQDKLREIAAKRFSQPAPGTPVVVAEGTVLKVVATP